jgi:hypothetical protein
MTTILDEIIQNMENQQYKSNFIKAKNINIISIQDKEWNDNIKFFELSCLLISEWNNIPAICIKKIFTKNHNNIPKYSLWIAYDNNIYKRLIVRDWNFYNVSLYK